MWEVLAVLRDVALWTVAGGFGLLGAMATLLNWSILILAILGRKTSSNLPLMGVACTGMALGFAPVKPWPTIMGVVMVIAALGEIAGRFKCRGHRSKEDEATGR